MSQVILQQRRGRDRRRPFDALVAAALALASPMVVGCRSESQPAITIARNGHLEDLLTQAEVIAEDSEVISTLEELGWELDTESTRANWQVRPLPDTRFESEGLADGLRITFSATTGEPATIALLTPVEELRPGDWDTVIVTARCRGIHTLGLRFNERRESFEPSFQVRGEELNAINDGSAQSYLLRTQLRVGSEVESWRQLGLWITGSGTGPATLELLSVRLLPRARALDKPAGVLHEERSGEVARALYLRAPGQMSWTFELPDRAALDFGLAVREERAVLFRVEAEESGQSRVLFEESYGDRDHWAWRTVDLTELGGQAVTLKLSCDPGDRSGVCFWGAPTLRQPRTGDDWPNILLYVIDGGGAELMSAYGADRPTTPVLEHLAAEGARFEHAFSNSSWTKPATSTLLTSLQHRVLGGFETYTDPLPLEAKTISQYLHEAGYATGLFVSNPFAGRLSGFERGVDYLRDTEAGNPSISSEGLHEAFWRWRKAFPAAPFFAHFQTTDVHSPWHPPAAIADRFLPRDEQEEYYRWRRLLEEEGDGVELDSPAWERTGIDPKVFYERSARLYEACLAHNDEQLGHFIERFKAEGLWQNTLLIVTADHGVRAAGLRFPDRMPPYRVLFSGFPNRIPMIFSWPGHVEGGQVLTPPVSLIDVLPTVLELVGLATTEQPLQGRSLVPLLSAKTDHLSEPVFLEEVNYDPDQGRYLPLIEMIDGTWGASLDLGGADPGRPSPLLLFDLDQDPYCLHSVHAKHPALVARYQSALEEHWAKSQALARRFSRLERVAAAADQLSSLRALGYIE